MHPRVLEMVWVTEGCNSNWASSVQIQDTFLKPEGPTDADRPQMSQIDKQHRWMRSCYSNTMLDFMVFACVCCIWAFILFLWQYFSLLHFKMNAVDSTFHLVNGALPRTYVVFQVVGGFLSLAGLNPALSAWLTRVGLNYTMNITWLLIF